MDVVDAPVGIAEILNEEILLGMEVRDGKLALTSGMEYRVLVLPSQTVSKLSETL